MVSRMAAFHERVRKSLPALTTENYRLTSPASWDYNCIAWALGVTNAWWWPVPGRYWPAQTTREESLASFIAVFTNNGYVQCTSTDLEIGWEKVALYALDGRPTHAARQLPSGAWSSKLGPSVDIEHANLDALAGGDYGQVVAVLRREYVAPPQKD